MKKILFFLLSLTVISLCVVSFAEYPASAVAEESSSGALTLLAAFLPLIIVFVIPGIVLIIVFSSIRRKKRKALKAQGVPESALKDKDVIKDLERITRLRQNGGLTDAEFESMKSDLLNKSKQS